jgi:hypothetical protein
MAKYSVPENVGRVRVAMALGGKYAVWNGKQGKHEFRILVRSKKQAQEVAETINRKQHRGEIEVWD